MDILGGNKAENGFLKVFKPLLFTLSAIGCARVNITNDSVSPRLWYQKLYSCICLLLCCGSIIYLTNRSAFYEIDNDWSILSILCYVQVVTTLLLNSCAIVVNTFFNIVSNCDLISKLQNIDGTLKITTNERHYSNLYRAICFFVSFVFIFNCSWNIATVLQNTGVNQLMFTFPALLILSAQDLELSFFCSIIIYLYLRTKYINNVLDQSIQIKWKMLKHFEPSSILRRLFDAYRQILAAYSLIEKTFNIFIVLLVAHMFVNELLALERFIVQGKNMSSLTLYQTLIVMVKLNNRIFTMGILVSRLEQQFENTKVSCLRVITHSDVASRHQAKNILRLVSPVRRMRIFCMFTVSSVPIQLVALTATYAVVLLQFSFTSPVYTPANTTNSG